MFIFAHQFCYFLQRLANPYNPKKVLSDILYFEKLDMTLSDLENNKLLKVDWYSSKVTLESSHNILVPKTSHFADVIAKLKDALPTKPVNDIRIMEGKRQPLNLSLPRVNQSIN